MIHDVLINLCRHIKFVYVASKYSEIMTAHLFRKKTWNVIKTNMMYLSRTHLHTIVSLVFILDHIFLYLDSDNMLLASNPVLVKHTFVHVGLKQTAFLTTVFFKENFRVDHFVMSY